MELPSDVDVPERVTETIELAAIVLLAVVTLRFLGDPGVTANVSRSTSSWMTDVTSGGLDTFLVLVGVAIAVAIYDAGRD